MTTSSEQVRATRTNVSDQNELMRNTPVDPTRGPRGFPRGNNRPGHRGGKSKKLMTMARHLLNHRNHPSGERPDENLVGVAWTKAESYSLEKGWTRASDIRCVTVFFHEGRPFAEVFRPRFDPEQHAIVVEGDPRDVRFDLSREDMPQRLRRILPMGVVDAMVDAADALFYGDTFGDGLQSPVPGAGFSFPAGYSPYGSPDGDFIGYGQYSVIPGRGVSPFVFLRPEDMTCAVDGFVDDDGLVFREFVPSPEDLERAKQDSAYARALILENEGSGRPVLGIPNPAVRVLESCGLPASRVWDDVVENMRGFVSPEGVPRVLRAVNMLRQAVQRPSWFSDSDLVRALATPFRPIRSTLVSRTFAPFNMDCILQYMGNGWIIDIWPQRTYTPFTSPSVKVETAPVAETAAAIA